MRIRKSVDASIARSISEAFACPKSFEQTTRRGPRRNGMYTTPLSVYLLHGSERGYNSTSGTSTVALVLNDFQSVRSFRDTWTKRS